MMAMPPAERKEVNLDPCRVCGSTKIHVGYSRIFRLCHTCAAYLLQDEAQQCIACKRLKPLPE